MQWGQNGVRSQPLDQREGVAGLPATESKWLTHLNGWNQPLGDPGFVDVPVPFVDS